CEKRRRMRELGWSQLAFQFKPRSASDAALGSACFCNSSTNSYLNLAVLQTLLWNQAVAALTPRPTVGSHFSRRGLSQAQDGRQTCHRRGKPVPPACWVRPACPQLCSLLIELTFLF
ncbi:unnamed protein product, partial [Boreogadus saida]